MGTLYHSDDPAHLLTMLAQKLLARFDGDPQGLADCVILLPNHRSCRRLQDELIAQKAGGLLLPRIYPIGELDEPLLWPAPSAEMALWPAVNPLVRLAAITKALYDHQQALIGIRISAHQATGLAREIISLMDSLDREGVPYGAMMALPTEQYAEHWQRHLSAVRYVLDWWPDELVRLQRMNPIAHRNAVLQAIATRWEHSPPTHPIIAAGSVGTQAATAALLAAIARLPQGEVIVCGLDTAADEAVWQAVEPTHPQWHFKQLLERMGASRCDVTAWDAHPSARGALLHEAMVPASLSYRWQTARPSPDALAGMVSMVAEDEWEQARAVALALGEAIQQGKSAALITPDAVLIERVESVLQAEGVRANCAIARTMRHSPIGQWLLVLAQWVAQPAMAASWLAMIRHPLCQWVPAPLKERVAEALELRVFRGLRLQRSPQLAIEALLKAGEWDDELATAVTALLDALRPLSALSCQSNVEARTFWDGFVGAAEALAGQPLAGEEAEAWRDAMAEAVLAMPAFEVSMAEAMLTEYLDATRYVPVGEATHPLHLLSPMEARLQAFDRVILGSVSEGIWPRPLPADAWLNEGMRQSVGLSPLAAHIGQEALDWLLLMSQAEVFVCRSRRVDGAEALASRWWQRLIACVGESVIAERNELCEWVRARSQPDKVFVPVPPAPVPEVAVRPVSWSVTQLDQLLRDPYGAYARHVLRLKALEPLDQELNAATIGSLLHEIWERFVSAINEDKGALTPERFEAIAARSFKRYEGWPQMQVLWWPRIRQMALLAAEVERAQREQAVAIWPERPLQGQLEAGGQVWHLSARVDRLEQTPDGQCHIVDYKSGYAATASEMRSGYACQLPVAAMLAQQAGIGKAVSACYWKLGIGTRAPDVIHQLEGDALQEVIALYEMGIHALIRRYARPEQPYWPIPVPDKKPRYNDYAHLARTAEWLNR